LHENVSKLEQALATIRDRALHDPLTGLPNREALEEKFKQARGGNNSRKTALLFLDMDFFKKVNDTHGHEFGDRILKIIADRLKNSVRETDIVARLGGDEFIIVADNALLTDDMKKIAQNVLDAFSEPFNEDGREVSLTASIGVAIYPDHGDNFHILLRHADAALYKAKESGRNKFEFYSEV
jgi:diguanylate cyclase (GGDEF)-like protein